MLSVCPHDCPSCCSLVVTVSDGRLTSVTGNPDHPFTRGVICGKVREYAERVHSPLRVLTPLRRVGPKGRGELAPISWDEAIATIAVMTLVKQARARGAHVVAIDPYRTPTAQQADEHLMVRPGTDAALALAVMHVLVSDGRVDRDYVERATLGFDRLSEHLRAYTPDAVAPIVGLDAATIVRFARRYGATPRTFIRIGIGLSRHDNGGMTCRTLACLPALTGAYADPHGGALLSSTAGFGFDYAVLERPDLMPTPPPRIVNMIHLGRALTDLRQAPAIRSLYVYSSNPAAVCPNQTLVLAGLAREDLFTVVHEQILTDTAFYADLVLPATTSLEHLDLYRSYGQFTLQLARPALPPQGQAKSNWEVFQLLARALGVAAEHYAKSPEALIREFLAKGDATVQGITFEELETRGWVRVNLPRPYTPFAHGAPTPSGKVEFYSERLARQGLPALPTYVPLDEGPENRELTARYPLQCLVPPNRFFLNSSFSQSALLRRPQGTPTVMLAQEDAERRGIVDGAAGI